MTTMTTAARHADKIAAVIRELVAAGEVKHYHRDVEVRAKVENRLKQQGAAGYELPSKSTYRRALPRLRQMWRKPR
jgi:hypothetical protein